MWKYPSLLFSTWSKKNCEKQIQESVDAASVREQPVPSVHSCTSVQADKSARVQLHSCTSVHGLLQSITADFYKTLFGNKLVIEVRDPCVLFADNIRES